MSGALREQVLAKQMDRKQFLQYGGGALLMVFGLHNLVSYLTGAKPHNLPESADKRHGFGSSKFGI